MLYSAPLCRRPVDKYSFSYYVIQRDAAPGVRVGRIISVVSKNKKRTLWDYPATRPVGWRIGDIGFLYELFIYIHLTVEDIDLIAGYTNDALDVFLLGVTWVVEDDDVAKPGTRELKRELVDDNEFSVVQGRLHA